MITNIHSTRQACEDENDDERSKISYDMNFVHTGSSGAMNSDKTDGLKTDNKEYHIII